MFSCTCSQEELGFATFRLSNSSPGSKNSSLGPSALGMNFFSLGIYYSLQVAKPNSSFLQCTKLYSFSRKILNCQCPKSRVKQIVIFPDRLIKSSRMKYQSYTFCFLIFAAMFLGERVFSLLLVFFVESRVLIKLLRAHILS